ncbi:LIM domain-containing protein A-like [Contarinia nasturtii]|uniref:LIM domain-containing protein A-like n=1 Tax=Contarinia nasturtii TaxID=265458 RepID=UPI0012D43CD1|nr:LIM domain-containing protein A-like [Contarinia nasturtii]
MGLMSFNVIIKKMKMPSHCRHLCLYILLFSVVISFVNAYDHSDSRSGTNTGHSNHFGRTNYIQLNTKNNNRDLSEFSLRTEQTPHHHHQQQQQHHFRHQNSHNSGEHRSHTNGNHHKHQIHQSNDNAHSRIPDYQRQTHLPKKHSHYENDNAAASNTGGGFHIKNHSMHHYNHNHHHNHHQHQQHQQKTEQRATTLGPFRSRSNNRGGSWSGSSAEIANKKNWSDNLSRNRQAPVEITHSSMNRNRTPYNPYIRSHHTTTTRHTTTTTTKTTTLAPDDFQEKVFFDAQNNFNRMENDDDDENVSSTNDDDIFEYNIDNDVDYSDENYDTKKRSPSIGSFDRHRKTSQQSNENFQRDDPVRSTNNGINTNTLKSQQSSTANDNNYQMNVNNDGNVTGTRNRNEPGDLTREKFQTLGHATAVAETFRQTLPLNELKKLAYAHAVRVSREGACKWPRPKLVQVGSHTSKTYSPHCTVLHRCSDETGCCHADYKTCQPRHKENVTLYFWVHSKNQQFVEHLTFENHTECHCISKSARFSYNDEPATEIASVTNRCRCPNLFTNVLGSHQCKCDCTSHLANDICNKLKRGLEHFSITERKCISSESCDRPTCAYGEYDTKSGHCPREDEALTFASNSLNSD